MVRDALNALAQAIAPQGFDATSDERRFTVAMADATAALLVPVLVDMLQRENSQVNAHVVGLPSRDPRLPPTCTQRPTAMSSAQALPQLAVKHMRMPRIPPQGHVVRQRKALLSIHAAVHQP